jgi:hypothetical protein
MAALAEQVLFLLFLAHKFNMQAVAVRELVMPQQQLGLVGLEPLAAVMVVHPQMDEEVQALLTQEAVAVVYLV